VNAVLNVNAVKLQRESVLQAVVAATL